jgi:hypothetical protein
MFILHTISSEVLNLHQTSPLTTRLRNSKSNLRNTYRRKLNISNTISNNRILLLSSNIHPFAITQHLYRVRSRSLEVISIIEESDFGPR